MAKSPQGHKGGSTTSKYGRRKWLSRPYSFGIILATHNPVRGSGWITPNALGVVRPPP